MSRIKFKIVVLSLLLFHFFGIVSGYNIFQPDFDFYYDMEANVELIPDVSKDNTHAITQWSMKGNLNIQRINDDAVAFQLHFDKNKAELKPLESPFKLISLNESSRFLMQHPQKAIEILETEPVWTANIKRALASLFQIEGNAEKGAFVSNEFSISGLCPTEYYVVDDATDLLISKIYDVDRCSYPGGIFQIRSNIPINVCESDRNKAVHAVQSRLGSYRLLKLNDSSFLLKSIQAESKSNVQSAESYYPQFIFTKIFINLISQSKINEENRIKFNVNEKLIQSDFTYVMPLEATGGRNPRSSNEIVETVTNMLLDLAQNLEDKKLNFNEPYMEVISEIIRLIETMDLDGLKKLYNQLDVGTSYLQETSKNIFLEVLPRIGTQHSVLLTKYLVMGQHVRSTTAVQLLAALPFFISELSSDLIKDCEEFLHVGLDRPDVKHSAVLSYSTMIYKAYIAHAISEDQFEKYVKIIFDLFLNSFDYEQQMLYLEAMGNLQLGNVPNYLQPIIQADYSQTTDIRFLAIFATMPTAHMRSEEIFETYWPIFYSKNTPLQLRIAAFSMLLASAQTPGRLLGLFNEIKNENCPHMINFYRTTVLSISESTYSCLSHLKRLILYMRRHLPSPPAKKYWITGNYIFDYKDRKFQIGSMLQLLLIGDRRRDLPLIVFLKFDTEAMGRFTGQLGVYIKARGLSDAIIDRLSNINAETVNMNELSKILKLMKMQPIQSTPLHLEFIVQYEGKTILSYYLNQTTFYTLTDGNIINRINAILRTDSHINMQLLRRPFVIKHAFPTLIGTPASILIENTMLASIRGSTTQNIETGTITRNNQVDLRYSSYAVAKILSYNPLDDIEYSTIREQGFLVYLPLNNEIKLNIIEKFIALSFYRKETLTSGMALKSRTRSFSGNEEIMKESNGVPTHQFNLEDIGINFVLGHNVESSKENLMFLFESDVATSAKVFTRTPYSIVQNILTLISMIQLTSIQISRDKHLTLLLENEPKSKVEITLKYDVEDFTSKKTAKEERVTKIDCNLLHLLDYDDDLRTQQLHKWEFSTKYTTFKNSKASQSIISFNRKTRSGDKWKLCIASTFDELVHFKKPLKLTSKITFGFGDYDDTSKNCPVVNKSQINLTLLIGSPEQAHIAFNDINLNEQQLNTCTKEIVKFLPSPLFDKCKPSDFDQLLIAINDIKMNVDFNKMPAVFYDVASRIDHLISAILPTTVSKLNLSEYVDLDIKLPTDDSDETKFTVNQNSLSIPLSFSLKHGSYEQALVDYNFVSMCSLYRDNLNTFTGSDMKLKDNIRKSNSYNNATLLVAECTETSRLGIFVDFMENSNEFLQVRVYIGGGDYISIKGDNQSVIYYKNSRYDLKESAFEYPTLESDFRISLTDDQLIEIENDTIKAKIQYNMGSLISISIPTIMKGKLCGLCSTHTNKNC